MLLMALCWFLLLKTATPCGLDLRLENGNQEYLKAETRFTCMDGLDTGLIPTMMPRLVLQSTRRLMDRLP